MSILGDEIMLPERMKLLRSQRSISQKKLAEDLGVGSSTIAQYETGVNSPNIEMINKLANYFCVSSDYILGRVDNPNSSAHDLWEAWMNIPDMSKEYSRKEAREKIKELLEIKNPFRNMSEERKQLLKEYNKHIDSAVDILDILSRCKEGSE
jgi:transcriptional regulator with XRE-family HTH domain